VAGPPRLRPAHATVCRKNHASADRGIWLKYQGNLPFGTHPRHNFLDQSKIPYCVSCFESNRHSIVSAVLATASGPEYHRAVILGPSSASARWTAPLGLLLVVSCGIATEEPSLDDPAPTAANRGRRDVLLVTVDTLRHDATGFSGSGKVATPLLDRLANGGAIFTSARAHAVVTLPSHASILSGLYPYEHGIHDNAGFVLAEGAGGTVWTADSISTTTSTRDTARLSSASRKGREARPSHEPFSGGTPTKAVSACFGFTCSHRIFPTLPRSLSPPGTGTSRTSATWR